MKIRIGVMGSADPNPGSELSETARALGQAIAGRGAILLTGATTGLVYLAGRAAKDAGTLHIGISPAADQREHVERYGLPTDACDAMIFTGFGLKGRNVVLVRSCDVALFIAGATGSLNELTIAHDEGKIIGCLTGTGGVADEAEELLQKLSSRAPARLFSNESADKLLDTCLNALAAGSTKAPG
jgi:uncharacterized protein (TIGR00725 family)